MGYKGSHEKAIFLLWFLNNILEKGPFIPFYFEIYAYLEDSKKLSTAKRVWKEVKNARL